MRTRIGAAGLVIVWKSSQPSGTPVAALAPSWMLSAARWGARRRAGEPGVDHGSDGPPDRPGVRGDARRATRARGPARVEARCEVGPPRWPPLLLRRPGTPPRHRHGVAVAVRAGVVRRQLRPADRTGAAALARPGAGPAGSAVGACACRHATSRRTHGAPVTRT